MNEEAKAPEVGTMEDHGFDLVVADEVAPFPAEKYPAPVERASVIEKLMGSALEQGADGVAALRELVELHREVAREDANRALVQAVAAFKAECPPIVKNRQAGELESGGVKKGWMYAELAVIGHTIDPWLAKNGLSYTWDSEPNEKGGRCTSCTLWHVSGASRVSRADMPDVPLPKSPKGGPHSIGASMSYGQRYSLIQVLGLTTALDDTDAMGTGKPPEEPVSDTQLASIEEYLGELEKGHADATRARLLVFGSEGLSEPIKTLGQLPASKFPAVADTLRTILERAKTKAAAVEPEGDTAA